ncbi:helix-turn-helix domain-containing protein [Priestia megaterium]|uniref:helix-turn-helix domain-containing protein n=1 Tax=Priestia megaterium TaxID=1404 RepID=UPI0023DC07DC|nr:helix-turn-helix transcriptional regulator [Priestia megaterium]MDF2010177.1 helix-turn-helix transcriptional regulator [Priestia megaterium]
MKTDKKEFFQTLKRNRKLKGITLKEVAEKLDLSTMYISEIERGKKVPTDKHIKELSKVYDIPEAKLFEGFGRIPENITKELEDDSNLFNTLYEVSNNDKLTKEQKERLYEQLRDLYNSISDN